MQELDGRVALITGGGGGIGRAIALTLAGEGMRVVVADVEADAAETVAAELAASGAEASAETVDVSDVAAVEALAERCDERYGGVDVLCNHAGVVGPTPIGAESLDNWRWVVDVNVLGLVHSIHAFVPRMLARIGERGRRGARGQRLLDRRACLRAEGGRSPPTARRSSRSWG